MRRLPTLAPTDGVGRHLQSSLWRIDAAAVERASRTFGSSGLAGASNLDEAVKRIADKTGKSIRIEWHVGEDWGAYTAFLLETAGEFRVLVRTTQPLLYQAWCVAHELGHILCGHTACHKDIDYSSVVLGHRLLELPSDIEGNDPHIIIEAEAEHVGMMIIASCVNSRFARNDGAF